MSFSRRPKMIPKQFLDYLLTINEKLPTIETTYETRLQTFNVLISIEHVEENIMSK